MILLFTSSNSHDTIATTYSMYGSYWCISTPENGLLEKCSLTSDRIRRALEKGSLTISDTYLETLYGQTLSYRHPYSKCHRQLHSRLLRGVLTHERFLVA
jgi:hypothetical protein